MSSGRTYVLGHSARELDRLDLQGELYRDATRRALLDAGLASGMRVLDIGCGSGDVSRLAAQLVGPSGAVTGIDRDEGTVAVARARTRQLGLDNVHFEVRAFDDVPPSASFDALVGRFVLMHQAEPGPVLRTVSRAVRPGGIVVFLESSMVTLLHGAHSLPPSPLYDDIVRWKCRVVAAAGADTEAGLRLRQTFGAAGLPAPTLRMEALIEGGATTPVYRYMAESIRSMLPVARAHGIDGFDEATVDTLETRLRDALVSCDGVLVCWPIVSAWCRVAAAQPA